MHLKSTLFSCIYAIVYMLELINMYMCVYIYVTASIKIIFICTFSIMRNTDLKYWNCYGSVILDCSHTRFTV